MKSTLLPLFAIAVLTSCNSSSSKETGETTKADTTSGTPAATNPAPATEEKSKVAFLVNDTAANTQKGTGNDRDDHIGLLNYTNMNLSFDLQGDVAGRPHRGWLHFSIDNFKPEPGTYTISNNIRVGFTRYETANAGGAADYTASKEAVDKGSEATITFTKFEKNAAAEFGEEYLASGTFSAKLLVKEANPYKRTSTEELKISNGTFENISVRVLGKKK